ncbi:unnamed protein product [Effrenium voratum]|nr:unnamed protein product [Effrenium voratum]
MGAAGGRIGNPHHRDQGSSPQVWASRALIPVHGTVHSRRPAEGGSGMPAAIRPALPYCQYIVYDAVVKDAEAHISFKDESGELQVLLSACLIFPPEEEDNSVLRRGQSFSKSPKSARARLMHHQHHQQHHHHHHSQRLLSFFPCIRSGHHHHGSSNRQKEKKINPVLDKIVQMENDPALYVIHIELNTVIKHPQIVWGKTGFVTRGDSDVLTAQSSESSWSFDQMSLGSVSAPLGLEGARSGKDRTRALSFASADAELLQASCKSLVVDGSEDAMVSSWLPLEDVLKEVEKGLNAKLTRGVV